MSSQAHRDSRKASQCVQIAREAKTLARQQAAIAQLSQTALAGGALEPLMQEAAAVVARTLRVERCEVLEFLPGGQALLLRAGAGWKADSIGQAQVTLEPDSQESFTLRANGPVVVEDFRKEKRFKISRLLADQNANSGISAAIRCREHACGILSAHSIHARRFSKADVRFVQSVANLLATAIDRKQNEESLQQQARVLKQIHDAVFTTDLEGRLTSWDRGSNQLFGYSKPEALRQHVSLLYGEGRPELLEQKILRRLKERGVYEIESRLRKKSGQEFYVHLSLSLLRDASKRLRGVIVYARDITARKKAQESLRKTNVVLHREIKERKLAEMVASGHAKILFRTLDALTNEPDLGKFLDELLLALTQELKAHSCALWFHDYATNYNTLYKTAHAGKILMGDQQLGYPYAAQPARVKAKIAAKARQKRPFLIENAAKNRMLEPELRAWTAAHGVKFILCIPLIFRQNVIGTLTIRESRRDHYTPQEARLAYALAQHVSLALDLIQLAEEGQRAAILQERNRVAREIHDTLGQGFTGIIVQLEAAEDVLTENPQLAKGHLNRARELARESLAEARRSVGALRPHSLEDGDLVTALRHLAYQMTVGKQVKVEFALQGQPRPLPEETEVHLLRIAQETLTNALKHGQASLVNIVLAFNEGGVQLSVHDNGRGFSPSRGTPEGGFGQVSLRDRAQQMGAKVTVLSQPGLGTRVMAQVPASSLTSGRISP